MIEAENGVVKRPANAPNALPTIYIPHTWPEIRNAEFEVLQRVAIAAANIGVRMVAIDNDGRPLWANQKISLDKSQRVEPRASDFMISLHFESPKLIDIYSYYALWQPLQFYHQFGYSQSVEKVITHNDLLSCDSDFADAHAFNLFSNIRPGLLRPLPELFHSPPRPYLEPNISDQSRLFYIGINWERINGTKGRHHDLLARLDAADLVDIYGPQKFLNAKPWDGFKTYRGELPFDGRSVVHAQNKAGVCLCLSSGPHKASGLMSNRLFEGLAAGAAIICDPNRFVERHFADVVYFVDDSGSDEDLYFQIRTILDDIRSDPQKARLRALEGQRRLGERFAIEECLIRLIDGHEYRVASYRANSLASASVSVVIVYAGDSLAEVSELIATATAQTGIDITVMLVCDTAFYDAHSARFHEQVNAAGSQLRSFPVEISRHQSMGAGKPKPVPTGIAVASALKSIESDYFCFLSSGETWFRDHVGAIIGALRRSPGATFGVSGLLLENDVNAKPSSRRVGNSRFAMDENALLSGRYSEDHGRFVYARSVLERLSFDCMGILDGEEANLVRLAASLEGSMAESALATYVRCESSMARKPESLIPVVEQQQYIRDAFVFDPRWQARMAAQSATREHIERIVQPYTVPNWNSSGGGAGLRIPIDTIVETNSTGNGAQFLREGFSHLEDTHTWVDGLRGVIEFYCPKQLIEHASDVDLRLCLLGRRALQTDRSQHCTLVINGYAVAYLVLPDAKSWVTVRLPPQFRRDAGRFRIELIFDHADVVLDRSGNVIDHRKLSAALFGFELVAIAETPIQTIKPGIRYPTTLGQKGSSVLVEGYSTPEEYGVWMIGNRARLRFKVQDFRPAMKLILELVGRASRKSGSLQRIAISLNGREVVTTDAPEQRQSVEIPLSAEDVGEDGICNVTLAFSHAEPVLNEAGEIADPRLLAAKLDAFQIVGDAFPNGANKGSAIEVGGSKLLGKFSSISRRNK